MIACPKCQHPDIEFGGQSGKCPKCGHLDDSFMFHYEGTDFNTRICTRCNRRKDNDGSWKCQKCWDQLCRSGPGYHDTDMDRILAEEEGRRAYDDNWADGHGSYPIRRS